MNLIVWKCWKNCVEMKRNGKTEDFCFVRMSSMDRFSLIFFFFQIFEFRIKNISCFGCSFFKRRCKTNSFCNIHSNRCDFIFRCTQSDCIRTILRLFSVVIDFIFLCVCVSFRVFPHNENGSARHSWFRHFHGTDFLFSSTPIYFIFAIKIGKKWNRKAVILFRILWQHALV